jgi:hypothetical protein
MQTLSFYLFFFVSISILSCNNKPTQSNTVKESYPFECKGVIQKTGMTIYMYGTHTISGEGKNFALQSTTIDLDKYVNKKVVVKGKKMEGYPIDNGPEFIDVKVVEQQE